MKTPILHKLIATSFIACLGFVAVSGHADDTHHPQAAAQKSYAAKGEVVAVDKAAGKVKLKHDAIAELEWPAMTMFFAVADKSQLEALGAGTRVEFQFVKVNGGAPLITQIQPVK